MIWYNLSNGSLKIPDPKKYKLVCTYLSLTELAFTPNNYNKLNEVQDAIRFILNLEPELILTFPFDYARTLIEKNYKISFNIEEDIVFAFLLTIINHPKEGLIENEFKEQLLDITIKRKENGNEWSSFLNNLKEPTKEISGLLKRNISTEWERQKFKEWFIIQVNYLNNSTYSADTINWKNFELYENVFSRYHRNLLVSKMKAETNDDNDLKNMIYVQPTSLYWTLEKRWLTIAKEAKVEKYLFQTYQNE
jgi:hypothetical protein